MRDSPTRYALESAWVRCVPRAISAQNVPERAGSQREGQCSLPIRTSQLYCVTGVRAGLVACCLGMLSSPSHAQPEQLGPPATLPATEPDSVPNKTWRPIETPPELGPAQPTDAGTQPGQEPEKPSEEEPAEDQEKPKSFLVRTFEKWDGEVSAGIDGSQGNTEILRIRGGLRLSRNWTRDRLIVQSDYRFARDDSGERENRLDALLRHERSTGEKGKLGFFTEIDVDVDSSLDFDARVRLNTGPTYWWVRGPKGQLRTSAGLAVTREFGAPDAEFIPEFTAEINGERQLTERMKILGSVRYDPEAANFGSFRLRSRGAVEFLIDPELRLSLRIEVENRFDSDPVGARTRQNDLDYAARLVWRF